MRKYLSQLIVAALIVLAIIFNPLGLLGPVRNLFFIVITPISRTLSNTSSGAKTFLKTLASIGSINKDNIKLRQENTELKAYNIKLKELQRENELLRQELKFTKSTNMQLISANIISKSPTGFNDSVIINKGTKDNLRDGQAVVSQGFLVGFTRNVRKNNSEVVLIASTQSKIPVYLQESRATGILQGGLKGLIVNEIPLDITPKRGEYVLTSDIGNILPRGIPIGSVKEVNFSRSEISHSALITSPIAFSQLETVFIVK